MSTLARDIMSREVIAVSMGPEVAVAAVDEGLLELMPNDSWKLLDAMMGRRGYEVQTATAQTQVVGFYRKRGFTRYGKEFIEAGIPHVAMKRKTDDQVVWPAAFVFRPLPRL